MQVEAMFRWVCICYLLPSCTWYISQTPPNDLNAHMAVGEKSGNRWNPGKWKHGLKPAVPWWFNFARTRMALLNKSSLKMYGSLLALRTTKRGSTFWRMSHVAMVNSSHESRRGAYLANTARPVIDVKAVATNMGPTQVPRLPLEAKSCALVSGLHHEPVPLGS